MAIGAVLLLRLAVPLSLTSWLICLWRSHGANTDSYQLVSPLKLVLSIILPVYLTYDGMRKKNVTHSGALTAMFMGWVFCLINYCFLTSLVAFYLLASKASKFRMNQKTFERDPAKSSVRTWVNVLCNGGIALQLVMFYYLEVGCRETPIDFAKLYNSSWWSIGVLSAIASASGDTFASELGPVLPLNQTYLVISLRRVPKGTNGGVSLAGTLASFLGGMVVGIAFYISVWVCASNDDLLQSPPQWPVIPVCTIAGFIGSMIDSIMGATLQYSGMTEGGYVVERPDTDIKHIAGIGIFDNHAINLFSAFFTSIFMPSIAQYIWSAV